MSDRSVPLDLTRAELLDSLRTVAIGDSRAGGLAPYVEQDLDRFLITFNLPAAAADAAVEVLEVGANPYFLTILLRWFRPAWRLTLVNFFGTGGASARQDVLLATVPRESLTSRFEMDYDQCDIEAQPLPYVDARFDLVYFCEVLEHFIIDPFLALNEIVRCLKPGGMLVLTTPNVARLENIARILAGSNIYDPYSGHGPHGRHNREYSRHEVAWMLASFGLEPITHFTADVHDNIATVSLEGLHLPPGREHDLGQYQFHLWKKVAEARPPRRPQWLYRSWPDELDERSL